MVDLPPICVQIPFHPIVQGTLWGLLERWPDLVLRHMNRLDLAQAVYGLRFITLLSALQNAAQYTRQNVLGLLAAYFPRPGTAGWPAAWQRYVKAFHLDGVTESELADFRRTVVKSVLRADRYFSARLTVGAEAHRGKDRTQAVLGKDLERFL
jgi:hypothetical protein